MKQKLTRYVLALCTAVILVLFMAVDVRAQDGLCPNSQNQLVIVSEGQPTAFRLRVNNLGDAQVSIFQFPLRGILEQTGPSPLDYVFLPGANFNGTTSLVYRVSPPFGCPGGEQLGRVTFAGGTAEDTAVGLVPEPGLCGVGAGGLAVACCAVAGIRRTGRRRRTAS